MQAADDSYQIIWLVRRLFRALAATSDALLRDLGISAADRAVMEFLYQDAQLSVPEIAQRYQVSRQHVQVTVNNLLEAQLVASVPNPRHKRSPLIVLTSKGRRLFKNVRARETKAVGQLFSHIPARQLRVTRETLASLLAELKQE